jgi:integrase
MNVAARRGLVAGNPISRLDRSERPRKAGKAPKLILERQEIGRPLDSAKTYRLLLSAALNTGLRHTELLGLLWSGIDFSNRTIYVTGQFDRGRKEDGVWIKPSRVEYAKTDAGYRKVELIPSDLFRALRAQKLASPYSERRGLRIRHVSGNPDRSQGRVDPGTSEGEGRGEA